MSDYIARAPITPEVLASIEEAMPIIELMDKSRIAEIQASVVYSPEEEADYAAYMAVEAAFGEVS